MRVVKRTDAAVTDPANKWLLSLLANLRLHLREKTLTIHVAQKTTHLVYLGLLRTVVAYLLTDTLAPPSSRPRPIRSVSSAPRPRRRATTTTLGLLLEAADPFSAVPT